MDVTTGTIPAEKMSEYLAGAKAREALRREAREVRRERAWQAARSVASALRAQCGAGRVVLFGSTVSGTFHERSDIDLAVSGIPPERFLEAIRVAELAGAGFDVDLVDPASARPWVAEVLAQDGVDL